jgi:hypothetical protein
MSDPDPNEVARARKLLQMRGTGDLHRKIAVETKIAYNAGPCTPPQQRRRSRRAGRGHWSQCRERPFRCCGPSDGSRQYRAVDRGARDRRHGIDTFNTLR